MLESLLTAHAHHVPAIFGQIVEPVLAGIGHHEIELAAGIVGLAAFIWLIHYYRRSTKTSLNR